MSQVQSGVRKERKNSMRENSEAASVIVELKATQEGKEFRGQKEAKDENGD